MRLSSANTRAELMLSTCLLRWIQIGKSLRNQECIGESDLSLLFERKIHVLTELLDFGLPIFKLNINGLGRTWVTLWTVVN